LRYGRGARPLSGGEIKNREDFSLMIISAGDSINYLDFIGTK
tara:strand:- start:686 stop:811 length:126 start_codon:yes stop_codon:yes gene_type:complete